MIRLIRNNTKLSLLVLVLLISPAFILWGVGSFLRSKQQGSAIGYVSSKAYTAEDLRPYLKSAVRAYSLDLIQELGITDFKGLSQYSDVLNSFMRYQDFGRLAWDRILGLRYAARAGIRTSPQEVKDWIKGFALFRREGEFSISMYQQFLKDVSLFEIDPVVFEKELRETLTLKKLEAAVCGQAFATNQEISDREALAFLRAQIYVVYADYYKQIAGIQVDDKQAIEKYNNNKERYTRPLSRKVRYVEFPYLSFKEAAVVTDHEVEEILKKTGGKTDGKLEASTKTYEELKLAKSKDLARKEAQKFLDLLSSGRTFDEAAQQTNRSIMDTTLSLDEKSIASSQGGAAFAEFSFKIPVKEYSPVIDGPQACFILVPVSERTPYVPSFEEIKQDITEDLKVEKAQASCRESFTRSIDGIAKAASSSEQLSSLAVQAGLTIAGPFTIQLYKPAEIQIEQSRIAIEMDVKRGLFSAGIGKLHPPMQMENYFISFYVSGISFDEDARKSMDEAKKTQDEQRYILTKKSVQKAAFYAHLRELFNFKPASGPRREVNPEI